MARSVLKVLLQSAKHLDVIDVYGQKPYCVLEYDGQQAKSKVCTTDGESPEWNSAYKFVVNDTHTREVVVTIKDLDSKETIGIAKVPLDKALQDGKDALCVPVFTADHWKQGELFVKLRFCESSGEHEQPTAWSASLVQPRDGNLLSAILEHGQDGAAPSTRDSMPVTDQLAGGHKRLFYDPNSSPVTLARCPSERAHSVEAWLEADGSESPSLHSTRSITAATSSHAQQQYGSTWGAHDSGSGRSSVAAAPPLTVSSVCPAHVAATDPRVNPFAQVPARGAATSSSAAAAQQGGAAAPAAPGAPARASTEGSPSNSTPPTSSPNRAYASESSRGSTPNPDKPSLAATKAGASAADRQLVEELLETNACMSDDVRSLTVVVQAQAMELRAAQKKAGQLEEANSALVSELESLRELLFSGDSPMAQQQGRGQGKDSTTKAPAVASGAQAGQGSGGMDGEMKVELEHLRRALAHRSEELEDALDEVERTREQQADTARKLGNAEAQLSSLRSRATFASDEKALLQKALGQLEAAHEHRFRALVAELEDAQRAISDLTVTKQQLSAKLVELMASAARDDDSGEEMASMQVQLRRAWSKNMQLQVRLRQLEGAQPTVIPADMDAAAAMASENEFLKEALIEAKLELAQTKERQLVAQRELSRARYICEERVMQLLPSPPM